MYVVLCIFFYVAKSQITRPFIKCFQKGTPNFLTVPPCKFLYMKYASTYITYMHLQFFR